ncbi:MAG TPA: c-type cytochrome [Kofleriaceae bacterium]|nr:c-type cytochrome [Kofleriaceae bacterium]
MTRPRLLGGVIVGYLASVAACIEPQGDPLDPAACPDTGTTLTYASFGATFFADHCNACHSQARNGAPSAFRFDTLDEVRAHADRIYIRAAGSNTTMPPGPDDPPRDERDRLAEWLACGAPE